MNQYTLATAESKKDAILASGAIIKARVELFLDILSKSENPLVIMSEEKSYFSKPTYRYITSYKGLVFYAEAQQALSLPAEISLITAESISVPNR